MASEIHSLINHIKRYVELSVEDTQRIADAVEIKKVKNKEHILSEGEVCQSNYFIVSGCLSKYINTESGDKQIFQFSIENWWMTDYTSLESGKPTQCNIQAVEDCVLISIQKEKLEDLYRNVPATETYFRKVLQRAYEASLFRIHIIFSHTGEQRYRHFANAFPDFIQRVPQYMLASYLGFTPEFLSKLRARKSLRS